MSRHDSLAPSQPQGLAPAMPQVQVPPAQPGMWRDVPVRALSIQSDVLVPLAWALGTGFINGLGLWWASGDFDLGVTWFGLTLAVVWLGGLLVAIRSLYAHERPDAPAPVIVAAPQPEQPAEGTIVINGARGRSEQRGAEREQRLMHWRAFLIGCGAQHTDVRYWQEQTDAGGKRFISDAQYYRYRRALMQSGDAAWDQANNHAAGWHLTRPAEAIYQDTGYWDGSEGE